MRIMKMLWILGAKGVRKVSRETLLFSLMDSQYNVVDLYHGDAEDGDLLCKRLALVTLDIYLDDHHLS